MSPFLVLYVSADRQIKVQAVAAPSAHDGLQAVASMLANQGDENALVVGVLTEEDVAGMSQAIEELRERIKEADPQE